MVKLFKVHKFSGLAAGALLLLLAVTGFFLDHDKWRFLYSFTFSSSSDALLKKEQRLFEGYFIDPLNTLHKIACGKRGIFESFDNGNSFTKISDSACLALRYDGERLFAATDNAILTLKDGSWRAFSLEGMYVNSIAVHGDKVVAAVDKHLFFVIDKESGKVLKRVVAEPNRNDIGGAVTLARFVRDLHYGRGYVDSELSLWINDYGAIALAWLSISGFIIWWRIKRKNGAKVTRKVIKTHSNIFALAAALPLVVLAVTGIFLDHAKALGAFMKSIQVPSYLLPPVYSGLSHDIWSVDFDGKQYRIGNRYGVFASSDLKEWRLENSGFAYRMFREGKRLYVSGMGAPNRVFENGKWRVLASTPHMFKDIVNSGGEKVFFSTHKPNQPLPSFNSITLYTLLLSLHDGTFFSSWWVWVNDAAAILLLLLIATGAVRWQLKKRRAKRLMLKR